MMGRTIAVALVAAACLAGRAPGQTPTPPDLRVLSLRSLQAGRTVRVWGKDIGAVTGPMTGVHDSTLWLGEPPAGRRVRIADIDSVWVSRGHAPTGAIVGGLIGVVVGVAAVSGRSCSFGDTACMDGALLEGSAIMLGGALLGALAGSGVKSWLLRYP